ncbi:hypothetical protein AC482_06615 [miscellaneous Crenarchaeota group-15 archaeon DG-45]|uniref:Uncharacterized protein n=1 Tax=miscellaneous Crenarchaeota group-15 archaeon DG-45 TaxID=1685127 RepID=A0A0M0BLZ6_9ARCH|nr:MAG: hypothetical protein AC482_06615 [miscellaneous Crenarchaeota group-15 archaeon DG-45]
MAVTRRRHLRPLKVGRVYDIDRDWFYRTCNKVRITRGPQAASRRHISRDEGPGGGRLYLEEFKRLWERVDGGWDPDEAVLGYELSVVDSLARPRSLDGFFGR